jgi:hypothetical protein
MDCIFICVFNQEKYIDMLYLLLESLFIYGNLQNTDILIYTSSKFMNIIKENHLFNKNNEKIKFEINDTYNNIDKACKSRLDLFDLSISHYNKILYLDTDIIIKNVLIYENYLILRKNIQINVIIVIKSEKMCKK